jgi:hypothetical protein
MHIVEVRRQGADLGSVMAQMRTWIDHHRVEPSTFEVAFVSGCEVHFRLQFQSISDASAFARVFDGELRADSSDKTVAA